MDPVFDKKPQRYRPTNPMVLILPAVIALLACIALYYWGKSNQLRQDTANRQSTSRPSSQPVNAFQKGSTATPEQMVNQLMAAIETDDARTMTDAGAIFYTGEKYGMNRELAVKLWRRAADLGDVRAEKLLAQTQPIRSQNVTATNTPRAANQTGSAQRWDKEKAKAEARVNALAEIARVNEKLAKEKAANKRDSMEESEQIRNVQKARSETEKNTRRDSGQRRRYFYP